MIKISLWLPAVTSLLLLGSIGTANADGDPVKGEKIYRMKCRVCHSNKAGDHRVGPSLFGVLGRSCGKVTEKPFTRYSPGYKTVCGARPFSWTEDRIGSYVTNPSTYLSELAGKPLRSPMPARLSNPQDRENVISYLKSLN